MPSKRTSTRKRSGITRLREKLHQIQLATTLTEAACLADECLALVDEIESKQPPKPEPQPSPRCDCGCGRVAAICILGRWWARQECYKRKLGLL